MKAVFSLLILILLVPHVLQAETFTFSADSMSGSRATGKDQTVLSGNARVSSDDLVLHADRIELSGENNRYIECFGSVQGTDESKGIRFSTNRLHYDRELKLARLEGDSRLEDKDNGVIARGRFIEYNDENGVAVLQVAVRIFKDKLVCRSEYALYKRNDKILELSGFPVVFKDGDEFKADRMRVDLETDDVQMEGAVSGTLKENTADDPVPES